MRVAGTGTPAGVGDQGTWGWERGTLGCRHHRGAATARARGFAAATRSLECVCFVCAGRLAACTPAAPCVPAGPPRRGAARRGPRGGRTTGYVWWNLSRNARALGSGILSLVASALAPWGCGAGAAACVAGVCDAGANLCAPPAPGLAGQTLLRSGPRAAPPGGGRAPQSLECAAGSSQAKGPPKSRAHLPVDRPKLRPRVARRVFGGGRAPVRGSSPSDRRQPLAHPCTTQACGAYPSNPAPDRRCVKYLG